MGGANLRKWFRPCRAKLHLYPDLSSCSILRLARGRGGVGGVGSREKYDISQKGGVSEAEMSGSKEPRYQGAPTPSFRLCCFCFQIPEWCHRHPGVTRSQRHHEPGDPVSGYTYSPPHLCPCLAPRRSSVCLSQFFACPLSGLLLLLAPAWPRGHPAQPRVTAAGKARPGVAGSVGARRLVFTMFRFFRHDFRVPNPKP